MLNLKSTLKILLLILAFVATSLALHYFGHFVIQGQLTASMSMDQKRRAEQIVEFLSLVAGSIALGVAKYWMNKTDYFSK